MEKILLKDIDKVNLNNINVYAESGGYETLKKVLNMNPETIIEEIKKSKLVGRGGAAFPTGLKWEFVRKEKDAPKFLICNADEGEPGTFKDRILLRNNPHLLLEAMLIAGYAIGANKGIIYIRGEYFAEIEKLKRAIEEAKIKGYLAKDILGANFSYGIEIHCGAGAYVCGEETSLLESLEGARGCSREKPPFPTHSGFMGKPTLINNVETLCNVPAILKNGGDWYSKIGSPNSPGTKLFCLCGHINKPGVYELPMGITLGELIEKYGGGVKGEFKAALPGGVSSSLLTDLDVQLDYKNVTNAGSMLGSGSIIVINKETSVVSAMENCLEFFTHESCGLCVPCREGTKRAKEMLTRIASGKGQKKDLDALLELSEVMPDTARCGLGQAAMNAASSAIKLFKEEFQNLRNNSV